MAPDIEQLVLRKSEWAALPTIVDFNKQTADQAAEIFYNFVSFNSKVGELLKRERSQMLMLIRDIHQNPGAYKDLGVRVGRSISEGKKKEAVEIYSVMLEANGNTDVLTMRVGQPFIEMSYAQNGRLKEIITETAKARFEQGSKEAGIVYERFA